MNTIVEKKTKKSLLGEMSSFKSTADYFFPSKKKAEPISKLHSAFLSNAIGFSWIFFKEEQFSSYKNKCWKSGPTDNGIKKMIFLPRQLFQSTVMLVFYRLIQTFT